MCNSSNETIAETLCLENPNSKFNQNSKSEKDYFKNGATLNTLGGRQCIGKSSSFKQACEFPIRLCRRSSKDLLTWINGFTSSKKTTSEIVQQFYDQMQSLILPILICIAIIAISMQTFVCLVLLFNVILEPGFLFLFSTFVGVTLVGLRIFTSKQKNKPEKKFKSKEI